MRAFWTSLGRSIRGSFGRFAAIAAIAALGCGFYGGLLMTGPDMRIAADRFYDGTHLYDIRVLSTLGFSKAQVEEVRSLDGVAAVMPAKSTDVMAQVNGEQYAMRIGTLPLDALYASASVDGCNVEADGYPDYLNRLVLEQGRWPEKAGECVISADIVSGVPVEMGDALSVMYGSSDLDGVLDVLEFTIVGTAHSSSFVSAITMGATSLGGGSIQQFAYVSNDCFSQDCPYTELFVSVSGAKELFSGSNEYQQQVDEVAKNLEKMSKSMASERLDEVRAQAQNELDAAIAEYEKAKAEAEAELADALEALESAESELASGQSELDSGLSQFESGTLQYQNALQDAQGSLDAAYDELAARQQELNDGLAQLEQGRAQVDAWPSQKSELQNQLSVAQDGLDAATAGIAQVQAAKSALESQVASASPGSPQHEALQAQIAQLAQQEAELKATRDSVAQSISQLQLGISEGDEQVSAFAQTQAQLESAQSLLNEGWTEYFAQAENAAQQLSASESQLEQARSELSDAQSEVEAGRQKAEEGRSAYEREKAEAMAKLEEAEDEIARAQEEIDELEPPDIYVLDRSKNYGVASQVADSERIDNIARVFPLIFFLVAALVALTTMTRMVDEERTLIGTFKALGYRKALITSRYLIYAGIASAVGAAFGLCLLAQVLPYTISKAYAIIYNIPDYPFPLPFDWSIGLAAGGLGVGITLFATLAAVLASLREQPASLMLPRAPKAGKRILLERIPPLWRRVSFSWKVTLRNLFRYKKRLFMTIVGIAGCTALLLTGWGLHNAIWDIIDKQFGPVVNYNVIVKMDSSSTSAQVEEVERYMIDEGESVDVTRVQASNMQVASPSHDALGVELVVPTSPSEFSRVLFMKERATQEPIPFDETSVVLTEKLARTLDVGVGDAFALYEQDDTGNTIGSGFELTVSGIMENYVGNWLYLGSEAYEDATAKTPSFTALYGRCTEDLDKRQAFTDGMHDLEGVRTITYNDETIDSYRKMLRSVEMIVVVLVVSAAALAFIVLYNLTNININERRREIASLKVLGFTRREMGAYIFREIALLSTIGALLGLALGVVLETFVVVTAEVDYVMFGREIHPASFVISFAMTLLFSAFVMVFMRKKLHDVDMVESLKSIE